MMRWQIEAHRNDITMCRFAARRAARSDAEAFTPQDDAIEGIRMRLNACYLHRATGGAEYGMAALRAWAKRNAASRRRRG